MAWIIVTPNPFEPHRSTKYEVRNETIQSWVNRRYPQDFPTPTICLLNGKALLREKWDHQIADDDVINFVAVQGWEYVALVLAVISIISAVLSVVLMPPTEGDATSDPVFSVKGQNNTIRLGEPVECCYGRNRIFPSFASRPYYEYVNNDQFQFSLFCIGHGSYEIHAIQIGDTLIDSYQEVEYELIPPSGELTLFPANVYTSVEVGSQVILPPNSPDYGADGWVGPFAANLTGTQATQLQVDIVFPKGAYGQGSAGNYGPGYIYFQIEYREIDDAGSPVGSWTTFDPTWPTILGFTNALEIIGISTSPLRKTFAVEVTPGRYEVRIRRIIAAAPTDDAPGNMAVWEAMRAWLVGESHDYGNVTLLAVKIRASNNLNEQTAQKFNVIATRKLPIRESSGVWSEPVTTRSIIWAYVDAFRSSYGGRITDDRFFDWDTLETLDALYTSRNEYFDWVFRDPTTVWDVARQIAVVGRAVPLIVGSLISIKRDSAASVPVAMFNHENIVQGTFEWFVKLWDLDEGDSYKVEYTDPSTGYKQETVEALLPADTSNHLIDLRLIGVQNRTHAYRMGLYMLAKQRYLRESVSFETGMEGFIPTYGDLIAVSHDVPKWGQAGYVVNAIRGAGIDYHLWLSEPLVWEESNTYQIMLRGARAQVLGPFTAYQTADEKQVIIKSADTIDFLLTGTTEPMLFMFGIIDEVTTYMKVISITPSSGENFKVTAVKENPLLHSFDELTPPALGDPSVPPAAPDLPTITQLYVSALNGPLLTVQVSWTAAFGSQYYVVQTSKDGVNWTERSRPTRTSVQLSVDVGDLYVRVAAINVGQGPWISDQVVIGPLTGLFLVTPWEGTEWQISWLQVLNMVGWVVKVYDYTDSVLVLERTETLDLTDDRSYLYDYVKALADGNLNREMLVTVDVLFESESGTPEPSGSPVSMELSNTIPAAPTSPQHSFDSGSITLTEVEYELSWTVPEEDDLIRVKVWLSPTPGFDPALTLPVYDNTQPSPGWAGIPSSTTVPVALDSDGEHPVMYWRVAVFDVWGSEIATNITAQQIIPAFA